MKPGPGAVCQLVEKWSGPPIGELGSSCVPRSVHAAAVAAVPIQIPRCSYDLSRRRSPLETGLVSNSIP
jgi:hypothetical protein